jgi:hypothetical protein
MTLNNRSRLESNIRAKITIESFQEIFIKRFANRENKNQTVKMKMS